MTKSVSHDEGEDASRPRSWPMSRAVASFEEIAASAQGEGPQRVTVDGRDLVVVVSGSDYGLMSRTTGQALIDTMQACPDHELFDRIEASRSGRDTDF